MYGNVWEWVLDKWHNGYDGAHAYGSAWVGFGAFRVARGGSWILNAWSCRSANRALLDHNDPRSRVSDLGFRLLQEL